MNGCNRAPGQGKVFEIVLGMGLCPFLSVEKGAMILSARSVMILSARGIYFYAYACIKTACSPRRMLDIPHACGALSNSRGPHHR